LCSFCVGGGTNAVLTKTNRRIISTIAKRRKPNCKPRQEGEESGAKAFLAIIPSGGKKRVDYQGKNLNSLSRVKGKGFVLQETMGALKYVSFPLKKTVVSKGRIVPVHVRAKCPKGHL